MDSNINHSDLVKRAQLGCQESMNRLSQLVEGRLCAYIYRLTLNYDLTQDLLQETLLEMVKSLKNLERVDAFWFWLYRTALGKAQHYFRNQRRRRTVQMSAVSKEYLSKFTSMDYTNGLSNMIRRELSNAIFEAMAKLKFRHRNVLVLRCFEQKPYSEIAAIMDCSEMAAQVLFFRAKRSLKRQLSRHGFGKGFLLVALGLFARITTPAKAASASSVTAASTNVGLVAAVIGTAGTKLGIAVATAITATALTIGSIAPPNNNIRAVHHPDSNVSSDLAVSKKAFEYPSQLLAAYDPDDDGWQGTKSREALLVPIVLQKWLVGVPPSDQSAVILPAGHWVELRFRGKIVDGPGNDILLIEWDANGEEAGIFITDGAGNEYLIGIAVVNNSGQPALTRIGFDISDISLSFEPCAVRIVGIKEGGVTRGFDLCSVRARIYVGRDDY